MSITAHYFKMEKAYTKYWAKFSTEKESIIDLKIIHLSVKAALIRIEEKETLAFFEDFIYYDTSDR